MASANVKLGVKGVDLTGNAWKGVRRQGKTTADQIRGYFRAAFTAAAAYMGVRQIVSTIKEMGNLSDMAMRAHTSVDELTKSATAFGVVGLKGLDESGLSMMFMQLERRTGRQGLPGFYETIEEIQNIPDLAKRGEATMAAFGRAGLMLQPIINGGKESVDALKSVIGTMPGVSQAAADAGDDAADAMSIVTKNIKAKWMEGIAFVIKKLDDNFTGGVRGAAMMAGDYLEYYIKKAINTITGYFKEFSAAIGGFIGGISTYVGTLVEERSFARAAEMYDQYQAGMSQVFSEYEDEMNAKNRAYEAQLEKRKKEVLESVEAQKKLADLLAKGGKNGGGGGGGGGGDSRARAPRVNNTLITAGSNAERLLALLGPQTQQAEQKRQTGYLKIIADNTKKTADNTDDIADGGEELGTV